MRLSLSCKATVIGAALLFLANNPITSSADNSIVISHNTAHSFDAFAVDANLLKKRAGDDHDHDHDHPTTTVVEGPIATTPPHGDHDHDHDHPTSSGAIVAPTAAPTHGDDHDHDHSHDDHDHDHSSDELADHKDEAGHSHGPARTCDPHDHDHGEYVIWHHIVALIVLIVVAGSGCVIPMMLRDNARTRFAVQVGKYFGAGVVLSVAFIHIMPEALFALTHPCLSKAWNEDYPGYAPLIMMISGLSMLVIEFLASTLTIGVEAHSKTTGSDSALESGHESHDHKAADAGHHTHDDHNTLTTSVNRADEHCTHSHGLTLLQCGPGVSTKVSTYMLELGIALHSVFIGIALGVLAGSEFWAMTIAICFHQFFEGIALGSRIAELSFHKKLIPGLLVLAFALVTPLGIAIGMGIHSGYKASSVDNLIVMGVFDSIACGVLLYTAFVTLLGGDILYSEKFRAESKHNKACYLLAVWLGASAMAILALWA